MTGWDRKCDGLGQVLTCGNGVWDGCDGLVGNLSHPSQNRTAFSSYEAGGRSSRASRCAPSVLMVRGNRVLTRARW
jgi:hypothetical protein